MNQKTVSCLTYLIAIVGLTSSLSDAIAETRIRTFSEMLSVGEIRMAVPYDRVVYVDAKSRTLGAGVEISKHLGTFYSEKYKRAIKIPLVPTRPGKLLESVNSGEADFALGYVDEYRKNPDPSRYLIYPHPRHENHILVSSPTAKQIESLSELSGQIVTLGRQTDTTVLDETNKSLLKAGKKPIHIYKDKVVLDDEDLLQMLNAGLLNYVFVAKWKATLWKPLFRNLRIQTSTESPGAVSEGVIVLRQHKELAENVTAFAANPELDKALDSYRNKDFKIREHALKNPTDPIPWARYQSMRPLFERYGDAHHIDPLFLASLAFQETMLSQSAISSAGAVGVMQLMPGTGISMKVGDIHQLEPNIHAGAKYINSLIQQLAEESQLSDHDRNVFAVAAYNAGLGNIQKARKLAEQMGFDPNKWFLNTEMAAAKLYGLETFVFVRSVYKYYVTYLIRERNAQLEDERLADVARSATH